MTTEQTNSDTPVTDAELDQFYADEEAYESTPQQQLLDLMDAQRPHNTTVTSTDGTQEGYWCAHHCKWRYEGQDWCCDK